MIKLLKILCLLAACNPAPALVSASSEPPKLVAQRVTATVKREAAWLVHLRTEHEALVTTPEHPFATPEAGWIPAGRLVLGDQVVSARFGTLRVLSVQNERAVQPQAVFNLTVASSHAYVVGTDQVLVHNRKCKDPADREGEIEAAEHELDELKLKLVVAVAEDKPMLQQQIAQLKRQIAKLKHARAAAWFRRRKAGVDLEPSRAEPEPAVASGPDASRTDAIGHTVRAIERLNGEIDALKGTNAGSQRLAELERERQRLSKNLAVYRQKDAARRGTPRAPSREWLLKRAEADYESRSREVEAAQGELSALLGEAPQSEAEKESHAQRRAKLEKELETRRLQQGLSEEILDGERRLAKLSGRRPRTDAEREQIAAERRALRATGLKKRAARSKRDEYRRARADPAVYEKMRRTSRDARRKLLRTASYVADTERPRDELELLEERLAACRQGAGSERLAQQAESLSEQIAALKALVEVRRERKRTRDGLRWARMRRQALMSEGRSVQKVEQRIARLEQEQAASRGRYVQLRVRESVLKSRERTAQRGELDPRDEARLREFERELEVELSAGGRLGRGRLRQIQHELASGLIDAEFLESIWREAEAEEAASQELQEAVQDEAEDVDALLRELNGFWGEGPSPERAAAQETGLQALQRELREERSAVEASDFALANEHAFLSQTLGLPGSSQHAAGAQRLAELQQQRLQLRIDWRARLQGRLDAAQQELWTRKNGGGSHASVPDAELEQRIALLEHEMKHPTF